MSDRTPITQFRRWLKEVPQPACLRLDENEKKTIRVSKQRSCWSDAEKSVLAMDATVVEALDNQGNILRVFRLREDEPEAQKSRPVESWPEAPEAQMAQIIVASNDRTGARLEAVFRMAFDRMAQMHDSIVQRHDEALQRAAAAEARLERERRQWLEMQLKAAGAPSDDDDGLSFGSLFNTFVEAKLRQEADARGAANGKAHANGKDATQ